VNLPKLTTINTQRVFSGCTALKSIDLPSLTTIGTSGDYIFENCTSLEAVNLPKVNTFKNDYNGCTSLKSVYAPSCVSLSNNIFSALTSLSDVAINANNIYLPSGTFLNCTGLSKIILFGDGESVEVNTSYSSTPSQVFGDAVNQAGITVYAHDNTVIEKIGAINGNPLQNTIKALYPVPVAWNGISANGEADTEDTTEITLEFDTDPGTLTKEDITVTGAALEEMTGFGHTRVLRVSGLTIGEGQNVTVRTVSVTPDGVYSVSPSQQTVAVHRAPFDDDDDDNDETGTDDDDDDDETGGGGGRSVGCSSGAAGALALAAFGLAVIRKRVR
jgi:hypothetical protein